MHAELHDLQGKIKHGQDKRRTLTQHRAWNRDDARASARQYAEHTSAAGRQALVHALTGDVRGALTVRVPPPGAMLDLGPLLLGLLGPKVLTAATAEALEQLPPAPDALESANELAALDADLLDLEQQEEALICAIEATGQRVMRRPDARPEIVLALEVQP